ncbi:hypothetical protein [Nocardia sp. NPDC003963]
MRRITPAPEFYRPNSDPEIVSDTSTPAPMTHQRRWTHENDVNVRLRRPLKPLANTGPLWRNSNRPLRVAPLELEVAQPLPKVCAAHGRPATGTETVRTLFYETDVHPRFHNGRSLQEISKHLVSTRRSFAPISTIVDGEWPICHRCIRKVRIHRNTAKGILAMMAANFVAFLVASFAHIEWLKPWLGSAFCPGSIIGIIVVVQLFDKSGSHVKLRPLYDERFAFVQAHPEFRRALQDNSRQ